MSKIPEQPRSPELQHQESALDAFIRASMEEAKLPGLAACIVRDGELLWSKGYGFANVDRAVAVTPQTPFMLGSLAQTVVAVAIMQLKETNGISLDDDVNRHLPFAVRHPKYPSRRITFRMLLSHTSSLQDDGATLEQHFVLGDSPIPLGDLLHKMFRSKKRTANWFCDWAPGTDYEYSNTAYALAAYLVECISGLPFDQYCQYRIFEPLGMEKASWRLDRFAPDEVAMPYRYHRIAKCYEPYGQYGYPDYPNHSLRVGVEELAHFFAACMNRGSYGEARLLWRETVNEMFLLHFPELAHHQALGWFYEEHRGARRIGHGGADNGVIHRMFYFPKANTGVIVLSNGDPNRTSLWNLVRIEARLFDFAAAIHAEEQERRAAERIAEAGLAKPAEKVETIPFPKRSVS